MTATFGGSFATPSSPEFHRHLECSEGRQIPDHERLHGREAEDGRVECRECRAITGPKRPHHTFGNRTHWA